MSACWTGGQNCMEESKNNTHQCCCVSAYLTPLVLCPFTNTLPHLHCSSWLTSETADQREILGLLVISRQVPSSHCATVCSFIVIVLHQCEV